MIEIQYNPAIKNNLINSTLLEGAALAALKEQAAPQDASLSILLTDDAQIQKLNSEYRGIDAPTDVLSFEVHERDPETGFLYLGEIIISTPTATRQANKNGHSLEAEVQLLVVHGVLHLLGHDHAEAEDKNKMWATQAKILTSLGLSELKIQEI